MAGLDPNHPRHVVTVLDPNHPPHVMAGLDPNHPPHVMAGLDPAIHAVRQRMHHRIDTNGAARLATPPFQAAIHPTKRRAA
jgi:hypothetical protein